MGVPSDTQLCFPKEPSEALSHANSSITLLQDQTSSPDSIRSSMRGRPQALSFFVLERKLQCPMEKDVGVTDTNGDPLLSPRPPSETSC